MEDLIALAKGQRLRLHMEQWRAITFFHPSDDQNAHGRQLISSIGVASIFKTGGNRRGTF